MADFDPRSAGHDYDWDALTPEDAIEIVLERLADLHEALVGDWKGVDPFVSDKTRPVRDDSVPAHIQMVQWMPILADYQMFASRANKASIDATKAEDELEERRGEFNRESSRMSQERNDAVLVLNRIKHNMRIALDVIDKGANDGSAT